MKSPVEQLPRRACAAGLTDSRASRASRGTLGDARAARHSPWHAVQCHCSLANAAHRTSRLLTRQHIAAPASSGGRGAAAPPPCPVHGAGTRQHGPPPAAGGARLPVEAPDAPSPPAALRSAAHGPRHAELTLSLPNRLPAEGLAGAHSPPRRPCPPPGRASSARAEADAMLCVTFWLVVFSLSSLFSGRVPIRCW